MARREQPLERDGSPTTDLAWWLRDVRNRSGMTVAQLKRATGFSDSTLYAAFSGKQLPSQQVTLAIVKACKGDVEAWRTYWADVRRSVDRDLPKGASESVVPPWAAGTVSSVAEGSDTDPAASSAAGGAERDGAQRQAPEVSDQKPSTDRRDRMRRPTWPLAISGMVVAAALAAGITALTIGHSGPPPHLVVNKRQHLSRAMVIVQNKDAIGRSSLLEDATPAYLSTRPVPRCRLRGCEVKGTDMSSGAVLVVSCWTRGADMTNENTTTTGIAHNPNDATSTLWYRGTWPNGRSGYLSEVYVAPRYRGGLGLKRCGS